MTEAEFQAVVVELAHVLGWHHLHVRRTIGKGRRWTTATNVVGWPDLFLWHERQHRTLAAELKSDTGKTTPEQEAVLASLNAAGIEVHVWRPADLDDIARTLTRTDAPSGRSAR